MTGLDGQQRCSACCKLAAYVENCEEWHQTRCGKADRKNLMRIHIIGGPGSGKTTLARDIGTLLGIEVYELDQIAFTGRDFAERALSDRITDINLIASRPAWITEGIFILWTDELLERADIIIWLDHLRWSTGFWRISRRFVRSALQEAKRRRGLAKFTRFHNYARHLKQLIQVLFSSRAYYVASAFPPYNQIESRQNTAQHLTSYKDKVIHCYSDEGVMAFLNYVYSCCNS